MVRPGNLFASSGHQEDRVVDSERDQVRKLSTELNGFDYNAPAELYPSRSRRTRGPVAYKRFDNAAEALRFAVEELPEGGLNGATLEVNEARFGRDEINYLYSNPAYPLARRKQAV